MPVKVSNVFDDGFEWISSDEEYEDDVTPDETPPVSIEPIVFTFFISYSILGVIRAEYVVHKIAYDHGDIYEGQSDILGIFNYETCQSNISATADLHNHVQMQTAYWLLGLNVAEMLPSLIVAPIIASWGKMFGVKAALLIPNIGYLVSSMTWLATIYCNTSLYFLIVPQILQGTLGGFPALMSLCNSFLADNRTNVDRTIRLVILGVISELGAGLTQVGIGYWISNTSFLPPYWCVFGAMVFNVFYIYFVLLDEEEEKTEQTTLKSDHKDSMLDFLFYSDRLRQKRSLLILVLLLIHMMVLYASLNIVIIHAFSPPLCWTSIRSGLFVAFTLFCGSFGTILGSRFFLLFFEELGVAQIGIWSFIGSLCMVAFGRSSLVVYIATLVGCFRFLISPALRNLLARVVDVDEQIVVFRLASMAETCGMLLGPTLFNLIYATSVAYSPSVTFVSMAAVYVLLSFIIL
ncbi:putative proton-coupled folate transporter [Apostichopus japonicus]|uniref:Proton-coupled folate transporter n=1 Tax=Stichopus japonicus TaxID=307972 RepID=A0A2G8K6P7_STIJA|nr:putative proton-coupled folate transporter [Apostichopus japonicus]